MTPVLRKTHRYTWFALAALLPTAWLAAVLVIPGEVCQDPVRAAQPEALPLLVSSSQKGNFLLNLRSDTSGRRKQLELLITKPLISAGAVIKCRSDNSSDTTIGLMGRKGLYRFDLDTLFQNNLQVTIADDLKQNKLVTFSVR